MSLVAYGSSDESSDEEVNTESNDKENNKFTSKVANTSLNAVTNFSKNLINHESASVAKKEQIFVESVARVSSKSDESKNSKILDFEALPKPRNFREEYGDIPEDNDIPLFKPKQPVVDETTKKNRTPARISIPSLSEFKDVDEDLEQSKNKPTASKSGTGLFSILPPPKNQILTKKSNLIPHVLTKSANSSALEKTVTKVSAAIVGKSIVRKIDEREAAKKLPVMDYDSNSEDDEEESRDFFSLSKPTILPEITISSSTNSFTIPVIRAFEDSTSDDERERSKNLIDDTRITETIVAMEIDGGENSTLVSTVMNLPREEILLKNKAEIGPKLPVPEQEFNVDSDGNVAFDEKAIEYLCGKRGVKRTSKMIEEANIIEINGEDIKPDEREWLVKALTEEPVQRPVSMQGAGPSSQSKKKHQITYLAHQAKAMEVELKNTWSQNRSTKKQTQSKYGF